MTPHKSPTPKPPLLCHCGAVALTVAGNAGFCKAHREEAVQATAKISSKPTGHGIIIFGVRQ